MKQEELKQQLDYIVKEVYPEATMPPLGFQEKLIRNMRKTEAVFPSTSRAFRVSTVTILVIFIVCGMILIIPQGRAWAQRMFSFFAQGENDRLPGMVEATLNWVQQTPGEPAPTRSPQVTIQPMQQVLAFADECGSHAPLECGIEDIRSRVNFPIYQLADVPEGFYFAGVTGNSDWILMTYETTAQSASLALMQEPWREDSIQSPWNVGESANIEAVKVGEAPGEYVRGSYDGNQNPPVWNSNLDVQSLRWVDNGVLFMMVLTGPDSRFGRDGMVALAENLTDRIVQIAFSPDPTDAPEEDPVELLKERFSMTVEEAADMAGIKVHQPALLPDFVSLLGARYETDLNWVTIFYLYDQNLLGSNQDGIVLNQMAAPDPADCTLCQLIPGDGFDVDEAPHQVVPSEAIEIVMIGGIRGQYVKGVWMNYTASHGWTWSPDDYIQKLRWQADGMAYELLVVGNSITKEDMVTIAKSIP